MKPFLSFVLWIGCCLTFCGCGQSVWKSDVCQTIEKRGLDSIAPIWHTAFKPILSEAPGFELSAEVQTAMSGIAFLPVGAGIPASPNTVPMQENKVPDEASMTAKRGMASPLSANKTRHSAKTQTENATAGECVDLNTATAAQLTTLPGIGRSRAEAILLSRQKKPFKRRKDITRIKGISVKSYKKMEPYLCSNSVP